MKRDVHPRYTGKRVIVDTAGRVERFADESFGSSPPEWLSVLIFGLRGVILLGAGAISHAATRSRPVTSLPGKTQAEPVAGP